VDDNTGHGRAVIKFQEKRFTAKRMRDGTATLPRTTMTDVLPALDGFVSTHLSKESCAYYSKRAHNDRMLDPPDVGMSALRLMCEHGGARVHPRSSSNPYVRTQRCAARKKSVL